MAPLSWVLWKLLLPSVTVTVRKLLLFAISCHLFSSRLHLPDSDVFTSTGNQSNSGPLHTHYPMIEVHVVGTSLATMPKLLGQPNDYV